MPDNIAQQWLKILCQTLPDIHSALYISLNADNKTFKTLAKWPESLNKTEDFAQIIKFALVKNEPISVLNVHGDEQTNFDYFTHCFQEHSNDQGIVLVKLSHQAKDREATVFAQLKNAEHWLSLANAYSNGGQDFYGAVIRLMASCIEQPTYRAALIALVSEITQAFGCERVAFGEYKNKHSKVVALSNSAQFDTRSNYLQKIADAMDEAIEQDCIIVFPDYKSALIERAHLEIARKFGSGSLLTLPLVNGNAVFGAITLLRNEEHPFEPDMVNLCKQTMALLAPFLALKKQEDQGLIPLISQRISQQFNILFGFKYLKTKLATLAFAFFGLLASFLTGDFQVTSDAVLEGKVQRVVAAPIDGYLISASVRAGDTVHKGDIMANLDDADLQLEMNKLSGQLQKFRREYREALSTNDLVQIRVISAQIDQATAELELTQKQLQKIALTAPYDSVVIEGDLSQMLGSPVERGDSLFKIAPLEGYRIILKVDEDQISYINVGQKGLLALASIPDKTLALTVQKITAIAKAEDNKNIFRVEANLDNPPALLRPGMEGIGKITVGQKPLLWIWTHEISNWFRLWLWSWWF